MNYSNKQYLQDLTSKQQYEMMNIDFFINKKLRVEKIKKGYVLPTKVCKDGKSWRIGGVLDENLKYIESSGQYADGEKTRVFGKYDFDVSNVTYIDEKVMYMNNFIDQWGHYLLDVIGRLWYAKTNKEIKIVYTSYLDQIRPIKNNFLQLLELLDIDKDRLTYINSITQFKEIIVPETSILTAKYYTIEYSEIIEEIVNNALKGYKLKKNRKIYCSRKHFSHKRTVEFGENVIEDIFSKNGYEIVFMEELSLIEQIRLLNEASEIVCLSGTLVHNAMFIRNSNCKFTILNKTYKINQNVYLTNQISKANFEFVDVYLAPLPISMGKGPYIVTLSDELIAYCKDNILTYDFDSKKINIGNIYKYYVNYFKKYHKKIFKGKDVGYSKYEKYTIDKKEVRKHYFRELKILRG